MLRFRNIRLRTKILLSFGLLIGAAVLLSSWTLWNFGWAANAFRVVAAENLPATGLLVRTDWAM